MGGWLLGFMDALSFLSYLAEKTLRQLLAHISRPGLVEDCGLRGQTMDYPSARRSGLLGARCGPGDEFFVQTQERGTLALFF